MRPTTSWHVERLFSGGVSFAALKDINNTSRTILVDTGVAINVHC